ncbi:venom acid phosphatase Acph-1-like [Epargyreus clarus]|uniref:venom acid phosphatase Acph-1-like n=1 Tax=Epargyreus clarus TaxID=520877 RepID=UPI003C2F1BF6
MMLKLFVLTCILAQLHTSIGSVIEIDLIEDRELLLAFIVNRHGERSPDADELSLSDEQEKLKNLTYIEGLEGLTNEGKRRAFQLGQFVLKRYGPPGYGLFSKIYFHDEIAVRSTDKDRTKMTLQVALSAVYPPEPEQQWGEGLGRMWQPIPFTAVPLSEDYLRFYSNCERFKVLMAEAKKKSIFEEFLPYKDLVTLLKMQTGRNFTEDPVLFETLFDLFKSQVALGLDIPEWAKPLLPKLSEAARLAYRLYFRNDEMKKIGGGVLLNNFITAATDIISGKEAKPRLHWFSGHDFNIGALMDVSKVVRHEQTIPEYGSLFALELYRSKITGQYTVLPVYLPKAGESTAIELHFTGCESSNYCKFSKFTEITKDFVLPEKEFYQLCNIRTEL